MNDRVEHIDIAKGISITLVALFHSEMTVFFPGVIEPMSLFRMPLFFFLSGVFFTFLFRPSVFLWKKSEALLKPYFSVLLLLLAYAWLKDVGDPARKLVGILYGNGDTIQWEPMWFLTHLFLVYCFAYLIFHYAHFNRLPLSVQWLCLMLLLLVGVYNIDTFWQVDISLMKHSYFLPGLPFSMDIVLVTSVFFVAGKLLRTHVVNLRFRRSLLGLSLLVFLVIALWSDAHIDLNRRVFVSPLLSIVGAFCGIYFILQVSLLIARLESIQSVFVLLGKSSLYILIFHNYIGDRTYSVLEHLVSGNVDGMWLAFAAFQVSILAPLLIKWAVERNDLLSLFFRPFKSNKLLQRTLYMRR